MPNLITFIPVGAELFHADGQTDMKKQIVTLCNSTNVPKIVKLHSYSARLSKVEAIFPPWRLEFVTNRCLGHVVMNISENINLSELYFRLRKYQNISFENYVSPL